MESYNIVEALEKLDRQEKEKNQDDPWLVYISDKGKNSCAQCLANHGKRFRESDTTRPALPIHPNCKCRYEKLDEKSAKAAEIRSATVRVDKSPGIGGIRISGIDDMLDKLEKQYSPGTLSELIISNHGGLAGRYPMGNNDDLIFLNDSQIRRLQKLLTSDAIIDIRMCYSAEAEEGNAAAQKLANRIGCKIRGYEGPVSPYGTRPNYIKPDRIHQNNYFQRIFPSHKPKIFYPQK